MGVLDDAIREHLELKRRHGAAEEEIARKEAEALGPARRGPAPEADAADAPPAAEDREAAPADDRAPLGEGADDRAPLGEGADDPVALPDAVPLGDAAPLSDDAPVDPDPAAPPPLDEPAALAEPDPPTSMADAATALGGAAAPPEPDLPVAETDAIPPDEDIAPPPVEPTIDVPAEVEPPAAIEQGGPEPGATQEFDTLSHREDPPAADEDVLEETPEFLRETPEHDRLWFEQKPPRDFDLDE